MLFTTFKVGTNEYKLRLTTKAMIDVENKLGENPLNAFMRITDGDELPKMSTMITILWGAIQALNHKITFDAVCNIYDEFIDEGNTMLDLIPILLEVFKVSGFMKADSENEEKN